jgi:copper homeostasis protein (lipoprotein)
MTGIVLASSLAMISLLALVALAAAEDGPLGVLPKSFTGTLPAASGPGIDWQVDLLADGSFQLRQTYLDREPDNVHDDIGRWVVGSDDASLLLQGGREAPVGLAIEAPDRLRLLDTALRPIESALPYTLEAGDVPPLEPELQLNGMYRYMADAAVFDECLTGRRLPVAFVEDNVALERAYLELLQAEGLEPGTPVLAQLEGRIAMLPPMEGDGLRPQLVPLRFIALHPDETCPEPFSQAELRGAEWQLVRLGDEPVVLVEDQRRPNLTFSPDELRVSGFAGCNRLIGGFAAHGDQLRFSQAGSTMMACPVGMDLEQALFRALEATERFRVLGRTLDLYDAEGALVARFTVDAAG